MDIKANRIAHEPVVIDADALVDAMTEPANSALPEPNRIADEGEAPPVDPKKKMTTMKLIVWICLLNGFAWVWCSYILAWQGKEQIAESLSQVALTEIIGVVLVYAVKSIFENLSKNNSWPDKPSKDPPDGVG